jgi:hypothetical protein
MGDDNNPASRWSCIVGPSDVNAMLKRSVELSAVTIATLTQASDDDVCPPEQANFADVRGVLFTI